MIPNLDIDVPSIDQVGMVVDDLEDGMARYDAVLGVGPWNVYTYEPPELTDTTYRGRDAEYAMRLAIGYGGETMLELIEPTMGPNIYADHLDERGEGMHHLACFSFDDPRGVVDAFEAAGMGVLQSGSINGGTFWYFDTADELNGVVFETSDRNVRDAPIPAPDETYPPGADPIDLSP
jgi:hypothetical protein